MLLSSNEHINNDAMTNQPFWEQKELSEMTRVEWESLCDGCAQCCVVKLEDAENGEIYFTDVVCHLLDQQQCRCTDYSHRSKRVPDCITLTPDNLDELSWMPFSCAYRRLAEGRGLAWWHPLVSGTTESVHESAASVRGKVVSENYVDGEDMESHIIDWIR
jgi:uncharacterized cysteine cluster protein YcgN (CxxCxxCC family)